MDFFCALRPKTILHRRIYGPSTVSRLFGLSAGQAPEISEIEKVFQIKDIMNFFYISRPKSLLNKRLYGLVLLFKAQNHLK